MKSENGSLMDSLGLNIRQDNAIPEDTLLMISSARPDDPTEDVAEIPVPGQPGYVWRINKRRTAMIKNVQPPPDSDS